MKDQFVKIIADYLNKMEVPKEKWDGTVGFFPAEWPLPTCTIADEIAEKLAAAIAPHLEAGAEFHDPSEYPARIEGEDFSVDVFILDETGVHGIAFWNFDDEVWRFHTDTLVDYNEPNAETKWKWYYPPFGLDQVFKAK